MGMQFYVLTNNSGCKGASAILYPGFLDEIRDQLGGDLYIIPSSIHECLILKQDVAEADDLKRCICEVNRDVLSPGDFLSDNLYEYTGVLRKVD